MRKLYPLYIVAIVGTLVLIIIGMGYCWRNQSGHSGLNPTSTIYLFFPSFLMGIVGIIFSAAGVFRPALALSIIGLSGAMFGPFISKLNILNSYNNWIEAEMPVRNPYTVVLLCVYLLTTIAIALLAIRFGKKSEAASKVTADPIRKRE